MPKRPKPSALVIASEQREILDRWARRSTSEQALALLARSRASFFMSRFRKLGFIGYNGRIQVHKSLLNVVLLDQLSEHNSERPRIAAVA
jgi:hypothetical protein